ncbi:hypothetical protein [Salinisphaera aquimarina]|uniref:Acireductone dioxygenase n=1 Tax=Salinisphaera aquimarina TaxID=2094031 RepID=A0ABV7ETH3_9GAMM
MTELYSDSLQTAELRLCDREPACISARLAPLGVRYQRLDLPVVAFDAAAECDEVIGSYLEPLNALLQTMPCATLDVTSVLPDHPRIDVLQRKLMTEHAHDTPEAQLMVWGCGMLFMRDQNHVWALRCEAGDFVRLPPRLYHWFEMQPGMGFRALRLFEERRASGRMWRGRDMRGVYRPATATPSARTH